MVLVRYYYSFAEKKVWGVNMREPDDDHDDYWLPSWITDYWPSDYAIAPDMPTDTTVNWMAEYHPDGTMTWIQGTYIPSAVGESEELENGSS